MKRLLDGEVFIYCQNSTELSVVVKNSLMANREGVFARILNGSLAEIITSFSYKVVCYVEAFSKDELEQIIRESNILIEGIQLAEESRT